MHLYRTESFSGSGERDAIEVMTFETEELGNSDILGTVLNRGYLKNNKELAAMAQLVADELSAGSEEPGSDAAIDIEDLMRRILAEIKNLTGYDIKYVLWLAPLDVVGKFYGKDMACPTDYDVYDTGPIVISYLEGDGILYGYETLPQPLTNVEKIPAPVYKE